MFTHTITISCNSPSGSVSTSSSQSGEQNVEIDAAFASNATNFEVDFAMKLAQGKSFMIVADQGCTVKTNSTSAPSDTLTLVAGVPVVWQVGQTNPFTSGVDVAKLYVTNSAGTTAGTLKVRALIDPTP